MENEWSSIIRTRIRLRISLRREPTRAEIETVLGKHKALKLKNSPATSGVTEDDVAAALDAGQEVRFDSCLKTPQLSY